MVPGAPALLASSGHQLQNARLPWYKVKREAFEQTCFLFDSRFPELACFPMTLAGGWACAEPGNEVFVAGRRGAQLDWAAG